MLVTFAGVRFEISEDWCEITDDLDPGTPPTLAREDGVGAIQFWVAKYESGAKPSITESDLKGMLSELLEAKHLAAAVPAAVEGSRCLAVGATSAAPDELVAAWYLSNGADVALVTYTCTVDDPAREAELAEAQQVVKTLEFA